MLCYLYYNLISASNIFSDKSNQFAEKDKNQYETFYSFFKNIYLFETFLHERNMAASTQRQ